MAVHKFAGQPALEENLIDVSHLIEDYYNLHPDVNEPSQRVAFGTSGHRGTSSNRSFNEEHVLAVSQAICEYRKMNGINGPLFLGKDTHALSDVAQITALEVFSANGLEVRYQDEMGYTPTPVISHAILTFNQRSGALVSDGVVITPSHNPPQDGGYKYNPPSAGPAGSETTNAIQARANEILSHHLKEVKRIPFERAVNLKSVVAYDFMSPYVRDLENVIDFQRISAQDIKIGVDPLGGAAVQYWDLIAEMYQINITVVNRQVDPTFSFMPLDHDGKIRMDCSSPYAMAGLINLKSDFDIAFGNDPDADRHGIVTPTSGLMNPNAYLAVAIWYLFQHRAGWRGDTKIGKTVVSSSMIDRVAKSLKHDLAEVPVGFKWFVDGLLDGSFGFGGEESAGASFLRKDGRVWTTDKDGIIMDLLAAEMLAVLGENPGQTYQKLTRQFGNPIYERMDAPASPEEKKILGSLSPNNVQAETLAGEKIVSKLTQAPYNGASIGGLKVISENGWFAARPSGTEEIYKIYAESFKDRSHLEKIQAEAQTIVSAALKNA
jgi:phosphoglucomutase